MPDRIFCIDTEYSSDRAEVHCLVSYEVAPDGGVLDKVRLWRSNLVGHDCPFPKGSTLIAYAALAESTAFRWLGWDPLNYEWIDPYVEFRMSQNIEKSPKKQKDPSILSYLGIEEEEEEKPDKKRFSLVSALRHFGLEEHIPEEKQEQVDRAILGGEFTREEEEALIRYCEKDVRALAELFSVIRPGAGLPMARAKLRGRYIAALSQCAYKGVPLDRELYDDFIEHKTEWLAEMLKVVDPSHRIWRADTSRCSAGLAEYIESLPEPVRMAWARTDTGAYSASYDKLKSLGEHYPEVAAVVSMLGTTSKFRRMGLDIEPLFGTNTPWWNPFGTKTGRNAPSTTRFAFNLPAFMRCFVSPGEGETLGYIDWRAQELGIAACRSQDPALLKAYTHGDVYMANAIAFGWAPAGATKHSHPAARSKSKIATLGLNYSMGAESLSSHMADALHEAKVVKQKHRIAYRTFYEWTKAHTNRTLEQGSAQVIDWEIHTHPRFFPRITTLNNFPIQSTGASMMRRALILAVEQGISVRAPVHDAFVICAPAAEYEEQERLMVSLMEQASRDVLGGFTIDAEVEKRVPFGSRYIDDRGVDMAREMMKTLDRLSKGE